MTTVLITQSNYLPWRGYFAAIREADAVFLLDNVQYTRRDWRNRNRIRLNELERWLTVPVATKGLYEAPISSIHVASQEWPASHAAVLRKAYSSAPGTDLVKSVAGEIERVGAAHSALSDVNRELLAVLCSMLGIRTELVTLREPDQLGATERLVHIARSAGADRYISGPSAAAYLDEDAFQREGIRVDYIDYSLLPPDPDGAAAEGELSIVDVLARRPTDFVALSTFSPTGTE